MSRSDQMITAEGTLAAPLPPCTVEATIGGATVAAGSLPADNFPDPPVPESYCLFFFPGSRDTIHLQPKDFCVVFTGDLWHLFYIRHHQNLGYTDNVNERNLGHATSRDLENWDVVQRDVLQVPGVWDTKHVWAPHIVRKQNDIWYQMFYTGVDANDNQRIGLAKSTNLTTWTRQSTAVLTANNIPWADPSPPAPYNGTQQFRDPFVMPDSTTPGRWLMYYTTVARDRTPGMVVGVAKTPLNGDFQSWSDLTPLWKTSSRLIGAGRTESPHAFKRHGKWWVMWTPTYSAADTIRFEVNTDATNTDTLSWGPHAGSMSPSEHLYSVTQGFETPWTFLNGWHATEYFQFRKGEYLCAYDDYNQSVDFVELVPAAPPDSFGIQCPSNVGVALSGLGRNQQEVELSIGGAMPTRRNARLQLALASPTQVDLAIYDVQGRRLRRLLYGVLPAGVLAVSWDGYDANGRAVGSGVYFARLLCPRAQRVARISLVR